MSYAEQRYQAWSFRYELLFPKWGGQGGSWGQWPCLCCSTSKSQTPIQLLAYKKWLIHIYLLGHWVHQNEYDLGKIQTCGDGWRGTFWAMEFQEESLPGKSRVVFHLVTSKLTLGFPGGSMGKNPPANSGDAGGSGSILRNLPWNRKWQPTQVVLFGKFHGQRRLVGYSPWGHKESDMPEHLSMYKLTPGKPESTTLPLPYTQSPVLTQKIWRRKVGVWMWGSGFQSLDLSVHSWWPGASHFPCFSKEECQTR